MIEADMRLECLRLAVDSFNLPIFEWKDVTNCAERYYNFVLGKEVRTSDSKEPDTSGD